MRYGAAIPHRDIGFVSDRRVVSEVTALGGDGVVFGNAVGVREGF